MRKLIVAVAAAFAPILVMAQTPAPAAPAPGAQAPAAAGGQRAGGGGGRSQFSVTSPTWVDGAEVQLRHAGRGGDNKSPALEFKWLGPGGVAGTAPATLASYAVIFHDLDVVVSRGPTDNLHWTLFNVPATATGLPEGIEPGDTLPDGSIQGPGFQRARGQTAGYFGPAPPNGPFHHYVFEVYALDIKLPLTPTATRDELMKAMEGHVIGKSVLSGRFRPGP